MFLLFKGKEARTRRERVTVKTKAAANTKTMGNAKH